jgi:hypothetical protein
MGSVKPFITSFAERGVADISTPEMKIKIMNAFATDGCFTEIKSPEMARIVQLEQQEIMVANQEMLIENENGDGEEESNDVGNISDSDSDSDTDYM